ncbi:hypothetical protein GWI33_022691 [Rhynchophorus ferrugineus]|uniref:Uncharacterized protein n=1 Tax=Rhynchophorus ferrugineus TaxID=354439 RepID=A0A834IQ06_RHYFE|nr:hypothetical protein GWI33_022691 [Rhynchophorus ferrugineus]
MKASLIKVLAIFMLVLGLQQRVAVARPQINSRVKRVLSDVYLTEMQSKQAARKLGGVVVTVPVAMGLNYEKYGRKRRSQSRLLESLFNQSEEDQGDPRGDLIDPNELNDYDALFSSYK